MSSPSVSVVVPSFNSAHFLPEALDSVLHQTRPADEIVVVDDGSTDDCRQVVEDFGSRVRYVRQENQGLAGARNTGVRNTDGELIGLLDADDRWAPDYLERMTLLARKEFAAAYYCSARCMDENGDPLSEIVGGPALPPEDFYQSLLRSNFVVPSTVLLRREALLAAGLFDASLRCVEDWELWLRLGPNEPIAGTSECLVHYRQHANSLSRDVPKMQEGAQRVIAMHFGQDDGRSALWSADKRRAYGGLYRFCALLEAQAATPPSATAFFLRRALEADPPLAGDLDLFYELALGSQQRGLRGSGDGLDLLGNSERVEAVLGHLFQPKAGPALPTGYEKAVFGTAYFALGLAAYNTGCFPLSRRFYRQALRWDPGLWREERVGWNFLKSFVKPLLAAT